MSRPYRKASEYLTAKQGGSRGPRTLDALEQENAELREKLTTSVRRLETLEVEFAQSREYFSTQLDKTNDQLNRTVQSLKSLQESYFELQSINYELEQKVVKVASLENERMQLSAEVDELLSSLTAERRSLQKMHKENERLRKDCNLAVSLLECNAGNFKQQRANELPRDLQNRVEEYQMDISQYNEYINPYADDSEEEEPAPPNMQQQFTQASGTVPTELLANVLKKPENVHLNLQQTDYISDPNLNSVYKGKIAEKKLIKHDYPPSPQNFSKTEKGIAERNNLSAHGSQAPKSSPWERAPTVRSSGSNAPWELSTNPQSTEFEVDDHGSASAYGAYPVSYKNLQPRKKRNPVQPQAVRYHNRSLKKSSYAESRSQAACVPATSPRFKKPQTPGENQDVYVSENFQQQQDDASKQIRARETGSGQNSQKSTPGKLSTGNEKGTSAERSSLLDEDDDDMVMTVELGEEGISTVGMAAASRQYKGAAPGIDGRKPLLQESDPEPDERDLDYENNKRRESEKSDGGESVPDIDLLHLDESVSVPSSTDNSTFHHIPKLARPGSNVTTIVEPSSLLPHLPPPCGPSYNEEIILFDSVPPPDMFGEATATTLSLRERNITDVAPFTPPSATANQSDVVAIESEPQEFEVAQSPKIIDATKTKFDILDLDLEKNELLQEMSTVNQVMLVASSGELQEGMVDQSTDSRVLINKSDAIRETTPTTETSTAEFSSQNHEGEFSGNIMAESQIPSPIFLNKVEIPEDTSKTERLNLLQTSVASGTSESSLGQQSDDRANDIGDKISNESLDVLEVQNDMLGWHSKPPGTMDNHEEPLEVLELEKEPRGPGSRQKRRNSFEKARDFGNILED